MLQSPTRNTGNKHEKLNTILTQCFAAKHFSISKIMILRTKNYGLTKVTQWKWDHLEMETESSSIESYAFLHQAEVPSSYRQCVSAVGQRSQSKQRWGLQISRFRTNPLPVMLKVGPAFELSTAWSFPIKFLEISL